MAAYNYASETLLTNPSKLTTTVSVGPTPLPPTFDEFENTVERLIDSTVVLTNASPAARFPNFSNALPQSYEWNNSGNFLDSVYKTSLYQGDLSGDVYLSDSYTLVTTAIDAAILALPYVTDAEKERKDYIVAERAQVDVYFAAANYTSANLYIGICESYLFNNTVETSAAGSLVLSTASDIATTLAGSAYTFLYWGGWYNLLTNLTTGIQTPYTFNFDPNTGGTYTIANSGIYPDGVYLNENSVLGYIAADNSILSENSQHCLVLTTVTSQINIFIANYNENDPAQVIIYNQILALYNPNATPDPTGTIVDAFAAEDWALTSTLILSLQSLLEEPLACPLYGTLDDRSNMTIFFTSLPTGTFTGASGTIQNTLTAGDLISIPTFPTNAADLTEILNADELGLGSEFADGVYQVALIFFVDGVKFECMVYILVDTQAKCCVRKASAGVTSCKKLAGKATYLNALYESMLNAFENGKIAMTNADLKKINADCASCNCGC